MPLAGHEPVSLVSLGMTADIASVEPDGVVEMALAADRDDAEAIFLSCTNLNTYDVLAEIEARAGKPVLSANQVTLWAALRALGAPPSADVGEQALFRARSVNGHPAATSRAAIVGGSAD